MESKFVTVNYKDFLQVKYRLDGFVMWRMNGNDYVDIKQVCPNKIVKSIITRLRSLSNWDKLNERQA
jgi:hypothetical protein